MYTSKLRRVGSSVILVVPPAILEQTQMRTGSAVCLTVDDGRLIVKPEHEKKYSLHELLMQCDADAFLPAKDKAWARLSSLDKENI